jgi:hypothetical protein
VTAGALTCPAGTQRVDESDSDVGWGEVERTEGCARRDGTLDGPAIQLVSLGAQPSTRLVGRFASGKRVGTWHQLDGKGALLGSFTLDNAGNGVEIIHDALGHSKRGTVIAGRREGTWTLQDAEGKISSTELWSKGTLVRQIGRAPWDPPMLDPADACPDEPATDPEDRDGCPAPTPRAK